MTENNNSLYSDYFKIIQDTINRIARNSFLIKAWTVTLIAGISVLTLNFVNSFVFAVLIGVVTIFWILDSYYLKIERLFRKLYEKNVQFFNDDSKRPQIKVFDMNYIQFEDFVNKVPRIMLSKSEGLFYIPLILALIILLVLNLII